MTLSPPPPHRRFATTRWSLVAAAAQPSAPEAAGALADLCQLYWYPVYAYVRRGHGADEAEDLTQAFFAHLLEKGALGAATPTRGRFRNFLLASCQHFLSHERERAAALKRGGGRVVTLDLSGADGWYQQEADHDGPERLFERRWALALLDRALGRLREEHEVVGKGRLFAAIKGQLTGEGAGAYAALGDDLGMSAGAVKTAVHRLRKRYAELLREEIRETVETVTEVEEEVQALFRALG